MEARFVYSKKEIVAIVLGEHLKNVKAVIPDDKEWSAIMKYGDEVEVCLVDIQKHRIGDAATEATGVIAGPGGPWVNPEVAA